MADQKQEAIQKELETIVSSGEHINSLVRMWRSDSDIIQIKLPGAQITSSQDILDIEYFGKYSIRFKKKY